MSIIRPAVLVLGLFALALPLSARDDDEKEEKPAKKQDEKGEKKDEKADEKGDKKDEKADEKDAKVGECEYYPLAIGTTWTYEVNGQVVKIKVAEHEKVKGVMCARLETETQGSNVASEHVSVTKTGVYRNSYNGMKIDPPLCVLKLPYKKGADWKVKSKQGGTAITGKLSVDEEDDVDVPAGTFKTIVVKGDFETAGQTFANTAWFAKGKGMVKQETQLGGQTITIELKKFVLGKGKVVDDDEDEKDDEKKPEGKKPEKKDDKKDEKKDKDF